MSKYLSPHLSIDEYKCRCCGEVPYPITLDEFPVMYSLLFEAFELIRSEWGGPIRINSGYRCPKHNAEVGGAPYSIHTFGLALDMNCKNTRGVEKMERIIDLVMPELRVGIYPTFVHMDVGYYINPRLKESWAEGVRWRTDA